MAMKRAFISFDFDHDEDLRNLLKGQAKHPDSPFEMADWSVHDPFITNWKERVRERIRKTDLTIVICGEYTYTAQGVADELTITRQEGKPYFLLRGRRHDKACRKPATASSDDIIHNWTWPKLKNLIAGQR